VDWWTDAQLRKSRGGRQACFKGGFAGEIPRAREGQWPDRPYNNGRSEWHRRLSQAGSHLGWGREVGDVGAAVTTKPQYLTSQPSLESFRLLGTHLVYSRRRARQPTGCEEGTRSVRPGFVGGRCGGAAPAQGRPLAADRPKYNNVERKNTFAPSFRFANQLRLSSYGRPKNGD